MKTPNINKILADNPRACRYGAPLGYKNHMDSDSHLHLQRVKLYDGDYAADGTYWGSCDYAGKIWCAFNGEDDKFAPAIGTRIFVRAKTRAEAIADILDSYPETKFKRA